LKLLTFRIDNKVRPGVLDGDKVIDLAAAGLPVDENGDLMAIVRGGDAVFDRIKEAVKSPGAKRYRLADVKVMAPLLAPSKVVAIGLNYMPHVREAKFKSPSKPIVFTKFSTSVTGPYDEVSWSSSVTKQVDYECELGVVIGRRGRDIAESEALDYVFGYTVVNDVSARDLQFGDDAGQWDHGKSLDTFCPCGPWIVTRDEIESPQVLRIRTLLNGKEMQNSTTGSMIFGVARLIAYVSQGTTLAPGDLIATGTPEGVGFARQPPVFMKDGDECVCEIERIGEIRNRMRVSS